MQETSALFSLPLELFNLQRLKQCHRGAYVALWGATANEASSAPYHTSPRSPSSVRPGRWMWHEGLALVWRFCSVFGTLYARQLQKWFAPTHWARDTHEKAEAVARRDADRVWAPTHPAGSAPAPSYNFFFTNVRYNKVSSSAGSTKAYIMQNPCSADTCAGVCLLVPQAATDGKRMGGNARQLNKIVVLFRTDPRNTHAWNPCQWTIYARNNLHCMK